jgi:hypothetical protein
MSRPWRIEFKGALYHVLHEGISRIRDRVIVIDNLIPM